MHIIQISYLLFLFIIAHENIRLFLRINSKEEHEGKMQIHVSLEYYKKKFQEKYRQLRKLTVMTWENISKKYIDNISLIFTTLSSLDSKIGWCIKCLAGAITSSTDL